MKLKTNLHFTLLTLSAMFLLLFGSCGSGQRYKIGVSQCSSDDWRKKMNEEIMREAMFYDDVEVEILSADDNSAKQIADLDHFLAEGVDAIVVAPNEADALTPKIKEIYEKGIPVIVFDRTIHGDTYTAFQGADNLEIGEMAAAVASNLVPGAKVLEIKGLPGSTPAELRHKGFHAAADSLGIKVVGEAVGNWNYDDALRVADSLLALYPETNVIYSHNDRMAIGAYEVAHKHGRDDIKIVGIDAAPSIGIQAVKDGRIDATFLYPTDGHQLVRTAMAILRGEPYEKNLILPTPAPVDASNAEILLLQDNSLREETAKIGVLQDKVDDYSQRYSLQRTLLYSIGVILLLSAGTIFLLIRVYHNNRRHRIQMEKRNAELAGQRDELDRLYHQLQEATGSKLNFFTNVSHDLRTPLTLIADPVHQLSEAENLTDKQRTLMQLADKNVKRLQRLINQILDIRKYDSGHLSLSLVNVNLAEALREWTAPFADLAAKRHVKFNVDFSKGKDLVMALDVEKTERILFNLLANAFKFTPENGSIRVTLEHEGNNAVLKIADTGCGIPPEEIGQIFERFFKTDRINPNGSGIGLALSKVFIDMMGGSISVESDAGKGSVFTVTLPIAQVEECSELGGPTSVLPVSDTREIEDIEDEEVSVTEDTPAILVIDDNRDICTLVKSVLSESYTVIVARSGAQGIRLANKYVPDLVICDVMMPGMDGYQVCKALKGDVLTSHIPVLLLTACSRDEQRIEGYDWGADAFMSKPFDSRMLLARCKSLLENRRLVYQKAEEGRGADIAAPQEKSAVTRPLPASQVEDEFLSRFIALVEDDISNPELSVETVAMRLGISRVQMYRKIKALTNYSASEMLRNIRLKRAANMLKTTQTTVSEVAYAVGFSSPSYFSRCYKDYYGESPVDTQNRTIKSR